MNLLQNKHLYGYIEIPVMTKTLHVVKFFSAMQWWVFPCDSDSDSATIIITLAIIKLTQALLYWRRIVASIGVSVLSTWGGTLPYTGCL